MVIELICFVHIINSVPDDWKRRFDLEHCVVKESDKAKFICVCEAMERHTTKKLDATKTHSSRKGSVSLHKSGNVRTENSAPKGPFYCESHGKDERHDAADCEVSIHNPNFTFATAKNTSRSSDTDTASKCSPKSFKKESNSMTKENKKSLG